MGFRAIADAEHAVTAAELCAVTTADDTDRGFSDGDVEAWMEAAVEPIRPETERRTETGGEAERSIVTRVGAGA